MKLLYLHQYFNTSEMSGGTRSYEMARRLVAKGHEVHMITSWRNEHHSSTWFETLESGIHVHWLPVPYSNQMNYTQRITAFMKFALGAARKARSIQADLVFATSTPLTIALPAVYAARRQKIPMVFEVRDLWPELPVAMGALKNPIARYSAQKLEKWAYQNAKAVIALSPGMKQGVIKTGYSSEQVAVIPNSSDNELFTVDPTQGQQFRAQRHWLCDKPLISYIGTFGLINGVSYAVELAKQLQTIAPSVRILLIGEGKEQALITEQAQQAGVLNQNLFIEKKIPKKEVPALLNATDLALGLFIDKPEMRANSSNKFFDALAAGRPLAINYGGWQKDLLESAQAGIVTWQLTTEQAAQLIAEKLYDHTWRTQAGHNAKKLAKQHFARDKLALQLEQVLLSALGENTNIPEQIASGDYSTLFRT